MTDVFWTNLGNILLQLPVLITAFFSGIAAVQSHRNKKAIVDVGDKMNGMLTAQKAADLVDRKEATDLAMTVSNARMGTARKEAAVQSGIAMNEAADLRAQLDRANAEILHLQELAMDRPIRADRED